MKEISAGIVIYRDTREGVKFLLLYHGGGYWNFPKGKLEEGERSFKAALREVKEETGINYKDLRFRDYFKVSDRYTFTSRGRKVHKTVDFYLAESTTSRIRMSPEHDGYGWFMYRDALKLLKYKNLQGIVKRAYDTISKKDSHGGGGHSAR
jgi:bis(5'-nucleosidyl)-tetraphosphatase